MSKPGPNAQRSKSYGQVKAIWGLKGRLGMDGETLRDVVADVTGQRSIAALSRNQATAVIRRLDPRGPLPRRRPPSPDRARQLGMLQGLWDDLGALGYYSPAKRAGALRGFLRKRFGVSDARFLDVARARAAIEALKAIKARLEARGQ